MYILDYLLHRFYHICTAQIIDYTDCITHVQLRLSTPQMFITNVQLTLSTPHILSQMYSLEYILHIFYHKCTAQIIYSTDVITNAQLDYLLHRLYRKCTPWIIYSTDLITNVQVRLWTPHIVTHMYRLDYLLHRFNHKCTSQIIYPQI